jgi:hypothetical protein
MNIQGMKLILLLVIFLAVVIAAVVLIRYNTPRLARSRQAMQRCVEQQGYTIVSAGLCWWPRGPFSNEIARHEPVYRVVASDSQGHTRRGWVRCTPFSDDAEANWETKP